MEQGKSKRCHYSEVLFCLPLLVPQRKEAAWPEVLLINLTSGSNPGVLPNKTAHYNMHTPG